MTTICEDMGERWQPGPDVVAFPDGCRIRGVAWRRQQDWSARTPDFSLVLLSGDFEFALAMETPSQRRWVVATAPTLHRGRS